MSDRSPRLPSYGASEYSLFISYAHADDGPNNRWITALRDAIWARLDDLQRDVAKKEIHFSGENGPSVGTLGSVLEKRVGKSFAMLLVVGDKYATSGWCEREIEFFCTIFGPEATKSRLLIAVMSQEALRIVSEGKNWRRYIAPDQIWVPMYQDAHRNSPLTPKLKDGDFTDAFFQKVKLLVDPLRHQIEADEGAARQPSKGQAAHAQEDNVSPWSAPSSKQLQIVLGPHTAQLAAKTSSLKSALESLGARVVCIESSMLLDYDSSDGWPIREILLNADVLVVPISHERPWRREVTGGHASLLAQEWAALGKSRSVIWYRPDGIEVPAKDLAAPHHLEFLKQLAPVCASEQAVANVLFTGAARHAIRVYIERHPGAPEYYKLAELLEQTWKSLPGDPSERPGLRCDMLDFNALDSMSKDVGGVVLLLPHRLKSTKSLAAQQKTVMDFFQKESSIYPGCVALIFKIPGEPASGLSWPLLEFLETDDSSPLVIDNASKRWLEAFLKHVLKQHRVETAATSH
jgi:hypothetical protein